MEKLFDCKYPIIEAAMNVASDVALAVAVKNAGGFPSLFPHNLISVDGLDKKQKIRLSLEKYLNETKDPGIILCLSKYDLLDSQIIDTILDLQISHVEILPSEKDGVIKNLKESFSDKAILKGIEKLKKHTKIITRLYEPNHDQIQELFDCFFIKGKESAGKTGSYSVQDLFEEQTKISKIPCVPYGGIATAKDVKKFIDLGARYIGIGTRLAVSQESALSKEAKEKIINAQSKDLINTVKEKQNLLPFDDCYKSQNDSDWNRTKSLQKGIFGNAQNGFVYVGHGIESINSISPVENIIKDLVSLLKN